MASTLLTLALLMMAAMPWEPVFARRLPLQAAQNCGPAPGYEISSVVDVTQDCRWGQGATCAQPGWQMQVPHVA